MDVKESLELLEYAEKLVDKLVEHKSDDGKIDMGEWVDAVLSSAPEGAKAFSGVGLVPAELKDLDQEEARLLAVKGSQVAMKVMKLVME